jgi:hypothetical protein
MRVVKQNAKRKKKRISMSTAEEKNSIIYFISRYIVLAQATNTVCSRYTIIVLLKRT